jgi:hypothetical protein
VSLPPAYLAKKLSQPLPIKGGAILHTIGEAAKYVLTLPHAESCNRWRRGAELLVNQADVSAVSHLCITLNSGQRPLNLSEVGTTNNLKARSDGFGPPRFPRCLVR